MDRNKVLELLTWTIADGTIVHRSKRNKRIQWKLSKQRKIDALSNLLNELGLKFTFRKAIMSGLNKLQPYYICLYADEARFVCEQLDDIKKFPERWRQELSANDLDAVLRTLEITDGTRLYLSTIYWFSTDRENIDIIKYLCEKYEVSCKVRENVSKSAFPNAKMQYKITLGVPIHA